ncbi:MAG: hypothetical protein Q8K61_06250 [Gallionella sp.]|nr:hypothetical protein [Gallionella sp.]
MESTIVSATVVRMTTAISSDLSLVDVCVLDHFVLAGSTVCSFVERGLL